MLSMVVRMGMELRERLVREVDDCDADKVVEKDMGAGSLSTDRRRGLCFGGGCFKCST